MTKEVKLKSKNRLLKSFSLGAFTLAEVLITLGIIGVVAEMTIPTLMNNVKDQVYKVSYKKAFSAASQSWIMAVNDDKIVSRPVWADDASKIINFNAFKSYFKVIKDCNNSNNSDCWAAGDFYFGSPLVGDSSTLAFIDASGTSWSLTGNTGTGPEILVDTNGLKKPNQYGLDRFVLFTLTSDNAGTGLPVKLTQVLEDYTSNDPDSCPHGAQHPCYYRSWLYN